MRNSKTPSDEGSSKEPSIAPTMKSGPLTSLQARKLREELQSLVNYFVWMEPTMVPIPRAMLVIHSREVQGEPSDAMAGLPSLDTKTFGP